MTDRGPRVEALARKLAERGMSDKQIARHLRISVRRVRKYVTGYERSEEDDGEVREERR